MPSTSALDSKNSSPGRTTSIVFDTVELTLGSAHIYDGLSFDVGAAEFVCLLGPSGCGKSTALRLIGGLLAADRGRVSIDGLDPSQTWDRMAYVFQSPRLLPWKDAIDNAAFGIELRYPKIDRAERRSRALHQLERVGLASDINKMPGMLSGGERQRVAIARALALEPEVILMDEPFSALDPNTRQKLRSQLIELWQDSGKTVVFVTHDIDEALFLADRIMVFSPKPARVISTLAISAARPRNLVHDQSLSVLRRDLMATFNDMAIEESAVDDVTVQDMEQR